MDAPAVHVLASALGALNTLNAYRPLGRRGPVAVGSYLAGRPTSELPLADTQHGFDIFSSPRSAAAAEAVGRFLGVLWGQHVPRQAASTRRPESSSG